jgi:hypothetical protein
VTRSRAVLTTHRVLATGLVAYSDLPSGLSAMSSGPPALESGITPITRPAAVAMTSMLWSVVT